VIGSSVLARVVHGTVAKNEVKATDQDTLHYCSVW